MGRLQGKVAFVTGGGGGLGRGMVELFAAEGASVLTLEIRSDWAQQTERELRANGAKVVALAGDVTSAADVRNAVRRCVSEWGRLDILVNNAGVSMSTPTDLVDLPIAEWDRIMGVNLTGAMLCIKEAAPVIKQSGGGSIINVTSISARTCYPGQGAYGISKAALVQMTRMLAIEWAEYGITVNAVAPGRLNTESPSRARTGTDKAYMEAMLKRIPMHRLATVDEVAGAVAFLASPAAASIAFRKPEEVGQVTWGRCGTSAR